MNLETLYQKRRQYEEEISRLYESLESLNQSKKDGVILENEYRNKLIGLNIEIERQKISFEEIERLIKEKESQIAQDEERKTKQVEEIKKASDELYSYLIDLEKLKNEKPKDFIESYLLSEERSRIMASIKKREEILSPEIQEEVRKKVLRDIKKEEKPEQVDSSVALTGTVIDDPYYVKEESTQEESKETPILEPVEPDKDNEEEQELIEVKEVKAWEWVKKNKKKILIGIGISAITIAIVIALSQLMPAMIASQMVKNAALWHTVTTSAEQTALHSANVALANALSSLNGITTSFHAGTGVWTLAGSELPTFAAAAAAKVQGLGILTGALTGLSVGTIGLGTLEPQSERYQELSKYIKENKEYLNLEFLHDVSNDITLSPKEKKKLLNKIRRALYINDLKNKVEKKEPVEETNLLNETPLALPPSR